MRKSNFPTAKIRNCNPDLTENINELRQLPVIDHDNVVEIQDRIDYFFQYCIDHGLRPGVELLATSLGVSRHTLIDWQRKGGTRGRFIDDAKQTINAILEELALNNEINPATLIWLQKNHFEYKDTVTVEAYSNHTGLDDLPSKEDIIKRLPKDEGKEDC